MARPREFDLEKAVEKAMSVFWEMGYSGTSLPDLLSAIGIARGSLYKAFGSKRNLFLKVLDLYEMKFIEPATVRLKDTSIDGDERIKSVFSGALSAVKGGDRRGCLLCNTAAGTNAEDAEIAQLVNRQLQRLTAGFAIALKDVAAFKDRTDQERLSEAESLTLSYVGLRVMTRGGQDTQNLTSAATQATSHL